MSRVGNVPIEVPENVTVEINDGNTVTVKGKKGELTKKFNETLDIVFENDEIVVTRPDDSREAKTFHGLTRSLIQNMVTGVNEGYEKKLLIKGVGYKANKKGNKLDLSLGFSHPVILEDPEGITTECPEDTEIIIKGCDKQKVGNYAAKIRELKKPEPYKGKGIRYADEHVRRKEGKLAN